MAKRLIFLVLMVVSLALPLTSVSAQDNVQTISFTEAQINDSYRVTNPIRRSISDVSVDVLDGQAAVSAMVTWPRQRTFEVDAVYEPSVVDGYVEWTLVSMTVNGQAASEATIERVNDSLRRELRLTSRAWLHENGVFRFTVTDIVLANDTVTIDYTQP